MDYQGLLKIKNFTTNDVGSLEFKPNGYTSKNSFKI